RPGDVRGQGDLRPVPVDRRRGDGALGAGLLHRRREDLGDELDHGDDAREVAPSRRSGDLVHHGAMKRSLAALILVAAAAGDDEKVDLAAIHRIKDEAYHNGQVMKILCALTDANGPRLTASPGFRAAAGWAVAAMKGWGASRAGLEPWGKFGRGWSLQR